MSQNQCFILITGERKLNDFRHVPGQKLAHILRAGRIIASLSLFRDSHARIGQVCSAWIVMCESLEFSMAVRYLLLLKSYMCSGSIVALKRCTSFREVSNLKDICDSLSHIKLFTAQTPTTSKEMYPCLKAFKDECVHWSMLPFHRLLWLHVILILK